MTFFQDKKNAIVLILGSVAIIVSLLSWFTLKPQYSFVDTQRLLLGFKEANTIDKSIAESEKVWRSDMKRMEDTIMAFMDLMNKEYNTASKSKKYEYQQELSTLNQQLNNFRDINMRQSQKKRAELMDGVFQKINVYMAEYGSKHSYRIIHGTVQGGNILYGQKNADITDEIVKGLNERYE
jgi:outer membrane protein